LVITASICPEPDEIVEFLTDGDLTAFTITTTEGDDLTDVLEGSPNTEELSPGEDVTIVAKVPSDDFRVMTFQITVSGATEVTVTFEGTTKVVVVGSFILFHIFLGNSTTLFFVSIYFGLNI
jgi:hypothetical protein